jgi:hypothetical protein
MEMPSLATTILVLALHNHTAHLDGDVTSCRRAFGPALTAQDCETLRQLAREPDSRLQPRRARSSSEMPGVVARFVRKFHGRCRAALGLKDASLDVCLQVQLAALDLDRDWRVFVEHLPPCPSDRGEARELERATWRYSYTVDGEPVEAVVEWSALAAQTAMLRRDHPGAAAAMRGSVLSLRVGGVEVDRGQHGWGLQCTLDQAGRFIAPSQGAASGSVDRRNPGRDLSGHMRWDVYWFFAARAADGGDFDGSYVSAYRRACPSVGATRLDARIEPIGHRI